MSYERCMEWPDGRWWNKKWGTSLQVIGHGRWYSQHPNLRIHIRLVLSLFLDRGIGTTMTKQKRIQKNTHRLVENQHVTLARKEFPSTVGWKSFFTGEIPSSRNTSSWIYFLLLSGLVFKSPITPIYGSSLTASCDKVHLERQPLLQAP